MVIAPSSVSQKRKSSCPIVDFPPPDSPTSAVICPCGAVNDIPDSACFRSGSALFWYEKETLSKHTSQLCGTKAAAPVSESIYVGSCTISSICTRPACSIRSCVAYSIQPVSGSNNAGTRISVIKIERINSLLGLRASSHTPTGSATLKSDSTILLYMLIAKALFL